jgi:hypothetical protein
MGSVLKVAGQAAQVAGITATGRFSIPDTVFSIGAEAGQGEGQGNAAGQGWPARPATGAGFARQARRQKEAVGVN